MNKNNSTRTHPYIRGGSGNDNGAAYDLVGTPIRITGRGGTVRVGDGKVTTGYGATSEFVMEYVPIKKSVDSNKKSNARGNQRLVAFRLKDSNLYLSQNPYGSVAHAETLKSISSLPILPEISREIVDFAVGQESKTGEGRGFDYRSMWLEEGPPGLLQQFTLEGAGLRKVGVKSVYGKYWRAPTWSNTVLQSPHQLGDEDFTFQRVQNRRW